MVQLKEDERLDYLLAEENMRIIQSPSVFAFSLDAVLLADFAHAPLKRGKIIDLCTGNGIVPLLLSRRTIVPITGVEIQDRLYDMAIRNVEINELNNQLTMIHGDLKDMPGKYGNDKFDLVTVNPPYFKTPNKREQNKSDYFTIARHEILCTLEDVVIACSKLAKSGGKVSMVHRPSRLVEIITLFKKYKIEPKRMRLVYPKAGKEANTLLIEGVRDGNPDLKILPPLYAFDDKDNYSKELEGILYGKVE
ncbi:tRNA1(Val) (adenine(37)-N6)-methyltransferase [Aquibacillus koreensis]|uniref:tRNA1(Val) (Adenine(37)-N6)-methyltransferase n=1 Tax=Aquibacillus koreensis TaxID=279446 RepID=A0A9X4ALF1_9BACI|nr:tRNA1(Val) (adenine(37)-N6)-methyltransferase [Aquibacillus koreensis]MCT2534331.1 tRNA1(Val) (adenine(37)-N6)-methyltransferase [Aquibacillus koreensis]MDC3422408.1 tRNA1(Val) (adenine(37)-N6)-methyltransferase [Aquibacillus koreensis]